MALGQRAASAGSLIRDPAGQFTDSSDALSQADDIRILASPPPAPRANVPWERRSRRRMAVAGTAVAPGRLRLEQSTAYPSGILELVYAPAPSGGRAGGASRRGRVIRPHLGDHPDRRSHSSGG